MNFADKVVIITGATSGIGRAAAVRFANAGAKVVLAGRRREKGEAAAAEITDSGGIADFVQTDVQNEDEVKQLISWTCDRHGRLDVAFNNAGVEHVGMLADFNVEDYRRVFDINVLGVFNCLKYEIPAMLESGGGSIINNSSVLGLVGSPGSSIYVATKHAVEGITKTAALELAQQGIRVNCICPGGTITDMIDRFAGEDGSDQRKKLTNLHPMGRLGSADEVASAVLYLASDAAGFTTGVSLPIDGGYTSR